jgi:hypothetical protein
MQTIGSVVDQLTIANIRLWHLEDIRRDKSLPDSKRLEACDKVSVVNSQRNQLIDEIDKMLAEGNFKTFEKCKLY